MNHIIFAIIGGVAAVTALVLWFMPGRIRQNGARYRKVPGTWFWFALTSAVVALSWPLIQGGPLGPYAGWLIAAWVLAAIVVAFAHRAGAVIAILAVAALLLGGPAQAFAANLPNSTATPQPTESAPTASPEEQVATDESDIPQTYPQRYLDLLTEHGYELTEVDGQTIPVFVAKSTEYEEKLWTDAVCLPVADRDAVLAMVLGSPDCAAQVASGLYRLPVLGLDGTTQQLGDISPWLAEWSDPSTLNDWAQSAMDSEGADRLEYARKLVLIAIQLERFSDGGVNKRETAYNFHAVVDGTGGTLAVDESNPWGAIPEFELSPKQYKGDFVIFRVTYKGYEGCWSEFGINIGDGRFAGFTCETPEPEPTPTPTPTTPPPAEECVKGDSPGSGYTWNANACKWQPPTSVCEQGAKPGDGYTWNQDECKWQPPVDQCVKGDPPGADWTWNQSACKWEPPTNQCVKPDKPGEEFTWNEEQCKWIPFDKPDESNPEEPEGVTPEDQPDPVETVAPDPVDPVDPDETPGDSIPEGDGGTSTDVDGDTGEEAPADPPATDDTNTGDEETPSDGEIVDPDAVPAAAGLIALPFLLKGLLWRRRQTA